MKGTGLAGDMTLSFPILLSFGATLFCWGAAGYVLVRDARSWVHRVLALGLVVLGVQQGLVAWSLIAAEPGQVVYRQYLKSVVQAFVPGIWLIFSLIFARGEAGTVLRKYRWFLPGAFVVPLLWPLLFRGSLFAAVAETPSGWLVRLGWAGYVQELVFLLAAVLILILLERTLLASTGSIRWRIKFLILGIGGVFAFQIYFGSQALLYSSLNVSLEAAQGGVLIVAGMLIVSSLIRSRLLNVDIYMSPTLVYHSVVMVMIGVYLLSVAFLAKAIDYFAGAGSLAPAILFVFLALLGSTVVLLSDSLRLQFKLFVSRHLKKPLYDYRKEWTDFTRRTTSILNTGDLCAAVSRMVSETLKVPAVAIWLADEAEKDTASGGVADRTKTTAGGAQSAGRALAKWIHDRGEYRIPIDLAASGPEWVKAFRESYSEALKAEQIRYSVPLVAGREFIGVMTLSDRVSGRPFSLEDLGLVRTIADQAAARLLNLRLQERLIHAKQMETFQAMSAFFMHDLKNLASTLSLTMQNLPVHFEDPVFRRDALRVITERVNRINDVCARLSPLRGAIELEKRETDVNALVQNTVARLDGALSGRIIRQFDRVGPIDADPEQLEKVLVNLILNADEVVSQDGKIQVTTSQDRGWISITVSDDGCGMSADFMREYLFKPFRTTKKSGLGIGLFHCKMIVEAHGGRIEVESEEGQGSKFRVMLPIRAGRIGDNT
jgi:putative PEP-CTERM system histidine kinase